MVSSTGTTWSFAICSKHRENKTQVLHYILHNKINSIRNYWKKIIHQIELVSSFKYPAFFIVHDCLAFKVHIQYVVKKLKFFLGLYSSNKTCFSVNVKWKPVDSTFLPVIDGGDPLDMNATAHCLFLLDCVHHRVYHTELLDSFSTVLLSLITVTSLFPG